MGTRIHRARLLTGLGLLWLAPAMAQPPAALVQVDAVELSQTQRELQAVGQVVPDQAGKIASRTVGTVTGAPLPVGTVVKQGDVLLTLDALTQRANLAEAQAALQLATAEHKLAITQRDRARRLLGSKAVDQATIDQREQEVVVANARRDMARVDLARAETDMSYTDVKAPFDGVITAQLTNLGAWVNRGDAVFEMVSTAALWIEVAVPSSAANGELPERLLWEADTGGRGEATVFALLPAENPRARTRTLRLQPTNNAGLLPWAPVNVQLRSSSEVQNLTVHKDAIVRKLDGPIVYVATDGKAEMRAVRLGSAVGSRLIVTEGLAAGDLVVVRGNERLRPGQAIRYNGAG